MNPDATLPLRDIHLPDPVSWWPPAPGWWALLLLLVLLIALAGWLWHRHRQRAVQRAAQTALQTIAARYQADGDNAALARDLSILLRRVCLSHYPRQQVAGLNGEAWLAWLDRDLEQRPFQTGIGRVLLNAPYQPQVDYDGAALIRLCRQWIETLPVKRETSP